jgi:hypothetical protein
MDSFRAVSWARNALGPCGETTAAHKQKGDRILFLRGLSHSVLN